MTVKLTQTCCFESIEMNSERLQRGCPTADRQFFRHAISEKQDLFYYSKQFWSARRLGYFIKILSKQLKLSLKFTNHCIKCTIITAVKEKRFSNCEISLIIGHKNRRRIDTCKYMWSSVRQSKALSFKRFGIVGSLITRCFEYFNNIQNWITMIDIRKLPNQMISGRGRTDSLLRAVPFNWPGDADFNNLMCKFCLRNDVFATESRIFQYLWPITL